MPGGREESTAGAESSRTKAAVVVDFAHSDAGVPVSAVKMGGCPDMVEVQTVVTVVTGVV